MFGAGLNGPRAEESSRSGGIAVRKPLICIGLAKGWRRIVKYTPIEPIDDHTRNRYEAVIVASRRARQINSHRLKLLEMMLEDSDVEIDGTKITTLALRDVMAGKVKYKTPDEKSEAQD